MRGQRDAALKALRRTKQLKEEQAAKLTELSVGFESMVLVRAPDPDPNAKPDPDPCQDPDPGPASGGRVCVGMCTRGPSELSSSEHFTHCTEAPTRLPATDMTNLTVR